MFFRVIKHIDIWEKQMYTMTRQKVYIWKTEDEVWKKEILDNQETKDIANKPPKQLV